MEAGELYRAGKLREAVEAQGGVVRSRPADVAARGFLAELLCVAGELERAEKQLEAVAKQDPESAVGAALLRQLLRAEQCRRECWDEGRVPEFVGQPPAHLEHLLRAAVALREGDETGARTSSEAAEEARPVVGGERDGTAFADLRDLDDRTASFLEVLTSTGKYYWIPFESVEHLAPRPPERPRDLLWRAAEISVRGGPDGVVYLPAIYPDSGDDESALLGRSTDWVGGDGTISRGRGLRTFLVDDDAVTLLEIGSLAFHPAR